MPLYDLVIAPAGSESRIVSLDMPRSEFAGFSCRPIDHVKLATLGAALGLGDMMSIIRQLEPTASGSEEGPWVSPIPASLVSAVEALDASAIQSVAAAWGASEEFKLDRIGPPDAANFLMALQKLIGMARSGSLNVYMWASL